VGYEVFQIKSDMPEVKSSNGNVKDSAPYTTFSQNGQSVTNRVNITGNIIFGGYSPNRSAL
jgi:hypothetical protein